MKKNGNSLWILIAVLAAIVLMLAIYGFSSQTGSESQSLSDWLAESVIGKIISHLPPVTQYGVRNAIRQHAHMFEYALLGIVMFFIVRLISRNRHPSPLFPVLPTLVFCLLFACLDEWHQTFVPGRAGRLSDVGIDAIGFVAGTALSLAVCALVCLIRRLLEKKDEKTD